MKIEINTAKLTQKEAIKLVNKTYKEYNTICSCYHKKKVKHYLTKLEKGICIGQGKMPPEYEYKIESRCSGTRGDEICSCNGDLKKCTHYPENRGSNEK